MVVPRSCLCFEVSPNERHAPAGRRPGELLIKLCDVDLCVCDPGDTFSPLGQAEQLALAMGEVCVGHIIAVNPSVGRSLEDEV